MLGLLTAIHILIAIVLIGIVLLQSSQGTDIAGAFGGMGSQAAFGPRGTATVLSKTTVVLAGLFMVTSVTLSVMGSRNAVGGGSVLSDEPVGAAPATPAAPSPVTSVPATPSTPPEGAPAVQLDSNGLQGMKATVTVENPGQAPNNANTPPAAVQPGGTPPTPPAQTQSNQPSPATPAPAGR